MKNRQLSAEEQIKYLNEAQTQQPQEEQNYFENLVNNAIAHNNDIYNKVERIMMSKKYYEDILTEEQKALYDKKADELLKGIITKTKLYTSMNNSPIASRITSLVSEYGRGALSEIPFGKYLDFFPKKYDEIPSDVATKIASGLGGVAGFIGGLKGVKGLANLGLKGISKFSAGNKALEAIGSAGEKVGKFVSGKVGEGVTELLGDTLKGGAELGGYTALKNISNREDVTKGVGASAEMGASLEGINTLVNMVAPNLGKVGGTTFKMAMKLAYDKIAHGETPYDDRDLVDKVFSYGMDILYFWGGKRPKNKEIEKDPTINEVKDKVNKKEVNKALNELEKLKSEVGVDRTGKPVENVPMGEEPLRPDQKLQPQIPEIKTANDLTNNFDKMRVNAQSKQTNDFVPFKEIQKAYEKTIPTKPAEPAEPVKPTVQVQGEFDFNKKANKSNKPKGWITEYQRNLFGNEEPVISKKTSDMKITDAEKGKLNTDAGRLSLIKRIDKILSSSKISEKEADRLKGIKNRLEHALKNKVQKAIPYDNIIKAPNKEGKTLKQQLKEKGETEISVVQSLQKKLNAFKRDLTYLERYKDNREKRLPVVKRVVKMIEEADPRLKEQYRKLLKNKGIKLKEKIIPKELKYIEGLNGDIIKSGNPPKVIDYFQLNDGDIYYITDAKTIVNEKGRTIANFEHMITYRDYLKNKKSMKYLKEYLENYKKTHNKKMVDKNLFVDKYILKQFLLEPRLDKIIEKQIKNLSVDEATNFDSEYVIQNYNLKETEANNKKIKSAISILNINEPNFNNFQLKDKMKKIIEKAKENTKKYIENIEKAINENDKNEIKKSFYELENIYKLLKSLSGGKRPVLRFFKSSAPLLRFLEIKIDKYNKILENKYGFKKEKNNKSVLGIEINKIRTIKNVKQSIKQLEKLNNLLNTNKEYFTENHLKKLLSNVKSMKNKFEKGDIEYKTVNKLIKDITSKVKEIRKNLKLKKKVNKKKVRLYSGVDPTVIIDDVKNLYKRLKGSKESKKIDKELDEIFNAKDEKTREQQIKEYLEKEPPVSGRVKESWLSSTLKYFSSTQYDPTSNKDVREIQKIYETSEKTKQIMTVAVEKILKLKHDLSGQQKKAYAFAMKHIQEAAYDLSERMRTATKIINRYEKMALKKNKPIEEALKPKQLKAYQEAVRYLENIKPEDLRVPDRMISDIVNTYSEKYNVDANFIKDIIMVETGIKNKILRDVAFIAENYGYKEMANTFRELADIGNPYASLQRKPKKWTVTVKYKEGYDEYGTAYYETYDTKEEAADAVLRMKEGKLKIGKGGEKIPFDVNIHETPLIAEYDNVKAFDDIKESGLDKLYDLLKSKKFNKYIEKDLYAQRIFKDFLEEIKTEMERKTGKAFLTPRSFVAMDTKNLVENMMYSTTKALLRMPNIVQKVIQYKMIDALNELKYNKNISEQHFNKIKNFVEFVIQNKHQQKSSRNKIVRIFVKTMLLKTMGFKLITPTTNILSSIPNTFEGVGSTKLLKKVPAFKMIGDTVVNFTRSFKFYIDVMRIVEGKFNVPTILDKWDDIVNELVKKKKLFSEKEMELIKSGLENDAFSAEFADEMKTIIRNLTSTNQDAFEKGLDKLLDISLMGMKHSEPIARLTTYLTTGNYLRELGEIKDPETAKTRKLNLYEIVDEAKRLTEMAHGNYKIPTFFEASSGKFSQEARSYLSLMKYTLNKMNLYANALYRDRENYDLSKYLVSMMFQAVVYGAMGLPFANDIKDLFWFLADFTGLKLKAVAEVENIRNKNKALTEMFDAGILGNLFNINAGGSGGIGIPNLWSSPVVEETKRYFNMPKTVLEYLKSRDIVKLIKGLPLVPNEFANIMEAVRGKAISRSGRVLYEYTPSERIIRALSFYPKTLAEKQSEQMKKYLVYSVRAEILKKARALYRDKQYKQGRKLIDVYMKELVSLMKKGYIDAKTFKASKLNYRSPEQRNRY